MYTEELAKEYRERAQAERYAGGWIEIHRNWPSISILTSSDEEFFFQDHEAQAMLDEVPGWISAEDFILARSTDW